MLDAQIVGDTEIERLTRHCSLLNMYSRLGQSLINIQCRWHEDG